MANLYVHGGSSISQEDWNEALALAERWREVRTDESHGATGKNLGLLARALLHLEKCYDEMVKLEEHSDVQRDTSRLDWLQAQLKHGWGDGFTMMRLDDGSFYPRPWRKLLEANFEPDMKTGAYLWQADLRTAIDEVMRRANSPREP